MNSRCARISPWGGPLSWLCPPAGLRFAAMCGALAVAVSMAAAGPTAHAAPAELAAPASAAQSPPAPALTALAPDAHPNLTLLRKELRRLIRRGGVAVGVDGKPVFEYKPGQYVPASILKLATAQAALHTLGPEYRFRTELYLDAHDTLYVRGYGDPYLVSESWRSIAKDLERMGVFDLDLEGLVLDTSAFSRNLSIDGVEYSLNPYDARLGALVTNFNTANVNVLPGGRAVSAEAQTPITPLVQRLARGLETGEQRINLSRRPADSLRYSGEVALAIFGEAGAHFRHGARAGRVPKGLAPLLVHRSERNLQQVIAEMLAYSNNYIANQMTLVMALEKDGPPARLDAGVEIIRRYLEQQLGLKPESFHLVEGSGISHRNKVDLAAMLRITDAFYPWRDLLRIHVAEPQSVLAKTGTLKNVHSLAGFLPAPEGQRRAFVIMLNQSRHLREGVLKRLTESFGTPPPDLIVGW